MWGWLLLAWNEFGNADKSVVGRLSRAARGLQAPQLTGAGSREPARRWSAAPHRTAQPKP